MSSLIIQDLKYIPFSSKYYLKRVGLSVIIPLQPNSMAQSNYSL